MTSLCALNFSRSLTTTPAVRPLPQQGQQISEGNKQKNVQPRPFERPQAFEQSHIVRLQKQLQGMERVKQRTRRRIWPSAQKRRIDPCRKPDHCKRPCPPPVPPDHEQFDHNRHKKSKNPITHIKSHFFTCIGFDCPLPFAYIIRFIAFFDRLYQYILSPGICKDALHRPVSKHEYFLPSIVYGSITGMWE